MLSSTTERVSGHTADAVNRRIGRETEERVAHFAAHPDRIGSRLHELTASGTSSGPLRRTPPRWRLPASCWGRPSISVGWHCPPLPIPQRPGFRTASEIEQERQALKALRGDFATVQQAGDKAAAALQAARRGIAS